LVPLTSSAYLLVLSLARLTVPSCCCLRRAFSRRLSPARLDLARPGPPALTPSPFASLVLLPPFILRPFSVVDCSRS
ncbi:hypothetical protein BJY59DRAFT_679926, partial [Rhodotorula toruloides]